MYIHVRMYAFVVLIISRCNARKENVCFFQCLDQLPIIVYNAAYYIKSIYIYMCIHVYMYEIPIS